VGSARPANRDELLIHARCVVVAVAAGGADLARQVRARCSGGHRRAALACLLASEPTWPRRRCTRLRKPGVALRFAPAASSLGQMLADRCHAGSKPMPGWLSRWRLPVDSAQLGRRRGRLAVIGLGPGAAELMVPAVKAELARARMCWAMKPTCAWPGRSATTRCCTAPTTAKKCSAPAMPSSWRPRAFGGGGVVGRPGRVRHGCCGARSAARVQRPGLAPRRPEILPGVSASLATAAQAGAPLGHDFCVMSLSDNLKPWSIIEKRLDLAAQADLVLAFYNPISGRGRISWGVHWKSCAGIARCTRRWCWGVTSVARGRP
jgi:cobalt-precorrin 5A hydrolase/precorrin-3B C17-methyltransferase